MHIYNFNTRSRKPGESISDYIAALRELALLCKFGTRDLLEEMLRDRLVCGVNHQGIQRKLLSEGDLTYESALKLAQTIEASERDSKKLGSGENPKNDVFYTPSDPTHRPKGNISCYRCGGAHLAPQCRHCDTICHYCKKKGHLSSVCRAKAQQSPRGEPPLTSTRNKEDHGSKKKPSKSTNYMGDTSSSSETEYDMHALGDQHSKPYLLNIELNNVPVEMELDTGTAVSIISESTYNDIRKRSFVSPLQSANSKLRTYTGDLIDVLGITQIKIRYEKKELCLSVHVVKGSGPNLLGRDWLTHLKVNLKGIHVIEHLDTVQKLLDKHSAVFNEELGCLKGTKVKLNVYPDAQPKFYKARTVPLIYREKVEQELDDLQKQGIISPVQFSKWAAPVVPVLKKNNKMRLCGDYKQSGCTYRHLPPSPH